MRENKGVGECVSGYVKACGRGCARVFKGGMRVCQGM